MCILFYRARNPWCDQIHLSRKQTNLCSTEYVEISETDWSVFSSFSQHRLGNRVKGTWNDFMVTIKGGIMLIWITGGHLFSGTLALLPPFFFSYCWLQGENYYCITDSSELHLIEIATNGKRWKADKAMNRRVTGVLSRGIIGPSETNIFFLRDCTRRGFTIRGF